MTRAPKDKRPRVALCDCGEPASRKVNSAWQCERCISISPDDYHGLTAGVRLTKIRELSGNKLLMEWKEANA